jgi:hypothetical protein
VSRSGIMSKRLPLSLTACTTPFAILTTSHRSSKIFLSSECPFRDFTATEALPPLKVTNSATRTHFSSLIDLFAIRLRSKASPW